MYTVVVAPRSAETSSRMRVASRRRIVAGALEAFAKRGFHGASMSEVARAAGVSKGLAYAYFRSKEDLLRAALEYRLDRLLSVVEGLDRHRTPQAKLAALIDGLLAEVQADPAAFRLYLGLTLQQPTPQLRAAFARVEARVERYLRRLNALFVELGSREPRVDAVLFRSALLGICVRVARASENIPIKALRARLLRLFGPLAR
jgi:AcrR family transcriptional regulator